MTADGTETTGSPTTPDSPVNPDSPDSPGSLQLSALDLKAIAVAKALAADAVEKAGSGHPGTAISLAPVATCCTSTSWSPTRPTPSGWGATASCCRRARLGAAVLQL